MSSSNVLNISGSVAGVSTGSNVTTLTLNGSNADGNEITGSVGDGTSGGTLAIIKDDSGEWILKRQHL